MPRPERTDDKENSFMNPNLLKGIGVPWGEMKGVEDSDAEPKVAAREMSLPLPLEEGTIFHC